MNLIPISLPHHQYQVRVESGSLNQLGKIVKSNAPHALAALFADEQVDRIYGKEVRSTLETVGYEVVSQVIPSGESHKTLQTVADCYELLIGAGLERKSPIIALGGGVTCDTVGFVAATYLRGVPLFQCPTTLLAMVDASVGGKTGVNLSAGKNLVGSFYQPAEVVIDPAVLNSLPARELRGGLAECVKHGVIRDAKLFAWIADSAKEILALEPKAIAELISRNVQIKADVVVADEREEGVRAHLNFGHTFAHAIEKTSGYGTISHGEAVSLGMCAAARYAADVGICEQGVEREIRSLLDALGLPTSAELATTDDLLAAMSKDKKVQDGRIRLVLPECIGAVRIIEAAIDEGLKNAWASIRKQ